ncbi:MAG: chromosome segregation protein SMC [Archaeoglobaceae archaeon]|nr:chromosome segregation protein SMC [Archaeoglobaceae archaeon]MDW7989600.1 chromosome segregation protein SMC [Archaeoglobaceae archaeon]
MLIKKITLRNFKSFSKRVEIPLLPGFIVITGPNGSGKSNIIDSILFCFALSTSTKQLRAERLTDLISEGKKEAEVSIVLGDNGKNYEITRKIKLTEKGHYSYYYLNERPVSLYEVQSLLSQFGIHEEAYNIVMQGDVTRIVEMSPVQRRRVLEDVAGISEFDEKKERALEELDRVRENIEKIDAVISEVELMLKSLERDRNDALRYKELSARKSECEAHIRAHEFISLKSSKERVEMEIERIEKERDRLSAILPDIMQRILEINEELKNISSSISKFGDENLSEIQTEILQITSEIETIKKSEKIYLEEIRRIEEEILRRRGEAIKIKEEIEKITRKIEEEILKKMSSEEIINDLSLKMTSLKKELENADRIYQELKNELINKKESLEKLKEERNSLISERDRLVELIRRIEIEFEDINNEKNKLIIKVDDDGRKLENLKKDLIESEKEQKNINIEFLNLERELFSLRSKLSDVEEEMKRFEVELAKIKTKIATFQSYSKPVEAVLAAKERRELSGIFGTVAQLGEVDEKFLNAIESAIGGALQFLVVETEDDAVEAIKYLKLLQAGRASFIPLRRIRDFRVDLDTSMLRERGVIDFAVNLVKCEKKFQPVFRFLLRDTLVVDTIDNARRLMDRKLRVTTLDGDLIEKSGLIVGGSREKKSLLISRELFDRERELFDKIKELQSEKDMIIAKLNSVEERRRGLKIKLEELNVKINEKSSEIKVLEDRISGCKAQIDEILEKIKQKSEERVKYVEKLKKTNEDLSSIEEKILNHEKNIKNLESSLRESKIPHILLELDKLKDEYSRAREILLTIEKRIENFDFQHEQLESSLKTFEREISNLLTRKEEINKEIEKGRLKIKELLDRLEILRNEEKKIGGKVRELRERRDLLLTELRNLEEKKSKVEFELKRFEDRISSLEEKIASIIGDLNGYGDLKIPDNLRDLESVKKELIEVQNELSKFGDVNLKAIQDYENVKMRRDELVDKRGVLEKERREIIERIEKYEKRKREIFLEVFNAVNRNFNQVMQELADGEGELFLDSEDIFNSGLYLRVKLKNKPMQRLEALSGGEKSLVALSFILAIQMFKPAPFYAFDEVDMFLDGVNVERVAKMIKKKSKDVQFIVVSLRKPMVENADAVIGVSMGGDNSSIVTGIRMDSQIQYRS